MSDVVPRDLKEEAEVILLELPECREIGVLFYGFKVVFKVAFHSIASFSHFRTKLILSAMVFGEELHDTRIMSKNNAILSSDFYIIINKHNKEIWDVL